MTILKKRTIRCAHCHTESERTVLVSACCDGFPDMSPDLDGRSFLFNVGMLERDMMHCKGCPACWSNLEYFPKQAAPLIADPVYLEQRHSPHYPQLANHFLCKAQIEKYLNQPSAAIWSWIKAAWACDDDNRPIQAILCRQQAVKRWLTQLDAQGEPANLKLIDLMRRSLYQEEAAELIQQALPHIDDERETKLMEFQLRLIELGDDKRYSEQEALAAPKFSTVNQTADLNFIAS